MKFQSNLLWEQFLTAFKECLPIIKEHEAQLLSNNNRTIFYNTLFEKVFKIIISNYDNREERFHYKKEFNSIDFSIIYQPQHHFHTEARWEIPLILIESENNANPNSNYREIEKLCLFNAPLKILFLCTQWNDYNSEDDKHWKRGDIIEGYWSALVEGYINTIGVTGIVGIFVLDIESKVFYYHKLVDEGRYNDNTQSDLAKDYIKY